MNYAICRTKKLKGAAVAAAGRHNARTRETPNADEERQEQNRILIGDDRPLEEVVREKILEHHPEGKPRKDSVEAIEVLLAASPEWFRDRRGEIDQGKRDAWVRKNVEWLQEKWGDRIVKAYLHLDEKTPHVQAVLVPIDPRGHLNAKHFLDGGQVFDKKKDEWVEKRGQKLRELQDDYAAAMKPLGLERGVRGSVATHERIQRFYGAIEREVELRVENERLPDPPALLATKAQKQAYKERVIGAVLAQLHEPFETMREQSMLAREERGKREAAEKRAAAAEERERAAEERARAAEARERTAHDGKERAIAAARFQAERSVSAIREESERRLTGMRATIERLESQKAHWRGGYEEQAAKVAELTDGLADERKNSASALAQERARAAATLDAERAKRRDVPLTGVMDALGYRGERQGAATIYRDDQGRAAMLIEADRVAHNGRLIARDAIDLTVYMRELQLGKRVTERDAVGWLADTFGRERAVAAVAARAERSADALLAEREQRREQEQKREEQQREQQRREHAPGRTSPEQASEARHQEPTRGGAERDQAFVR